MAKSQIQRQSANVRQVRKTAHVSVTGKVIRFWANGKQVVSVLMLNENPVSLLLSGLTTDRTMRLTRRLLKPFPLFLTTLRKEFAAHQELTEATGMKVYFCDPYSPWQRGTNENTNGLLRQFFPKGTSFADISDDDLQNIVYLINNRPRKRLNFLTPFEVLMKFFS